MAGGDVHLLRMGCDGKTAKSRFWKNRRFAAPRLRVTVADHLIPDADHVPHPKRARRGRGGGGIMKTGLPRTGARHRARRTAAFDELMAVPPASDVRLTDGHSVPGHHVVVAVDTLPGRVHHQLVAPGLRPAPVAEGYGLTRFGVRGKQPPARAAPRKPRTPRRARCRPAPRCGCPCQG